MPTARDKLAGKTTKLSGLQIPLEDHPANLNNYQDGSFYHVDVDLILPNPDQPRKFFDQEALNELATSIKEKGILQPVIIRKDGEGQIYLVAGERRLKAAKIAGLERIPAIITKGNPAEIALIENLQREDLKPVEEAEALGRMVEEYGYTHEQLATVVSKARSTITETLALNKLPEEIKEECRRADNYPRRLLVEIAKQDTPAKMISLFARVKEGNLKSDQVREINRTKTIREKQRTPAAVALDKTTTLFKHLAKLDLATVEDTEKAQLLFELQTLKNAIDKLLK